MDRWFDLIGSDCSLSVPALGKLQQNGYAIMPGPIPEERIPRAAAAYDFAMSSAGPDLKIASTTERLCDFVNRGAEFDGLYVHPPLLEACRQVIKAPFKLSSSLGRTLRAGSKAQELHADLPRHSDDLPMLGFILMVDDFRPENGATRFVPESHKWSSVPEDVMRDRRAAYPEETLACGSAGSMIVFDASIWHGHTPNTTVLPRRSVQGYFVRREARSGMNFGLRMRAETLERIQSACPIPAGDLKA